MYMYIDIDIDIDIDIVYYICKDMYIDIYRYICIYHLIICVICLFVICLISKRGVFNRFNFYKNQT